MNQEQARFNMIEQQIRPWNVADDDVLNIMKQIPREHFVPDNYKSLAFADIQAPLANGQQMMEPKIEARMLQALQINPGDKVLEVGTGSGYITACLDWLSDEVTSIEIHEQLSQLARPDAAHRHPRSVAETAGRRHLAARADQGTLCARRLDLDLLG